jgi:ABC-2 type transport system permease protein
VVVTVGASAITSSVVQCPTSCRADPAKISLTGVMLGQTTMAVLAVLLVSSEYSSGMISVSLAAVPRRLEMLVAKAAVLTAVVMAAGVVSVLGSLLAGQLLLPGNGFTAKHGFVPTTLAHGPMMRAAAGSVLYFVLIALFSLGLATAVRDSGAAITIALGLLFVLPILGTVLLNPHWQRRFDRYSPMNAGLAIQATRNLSKLPIGPWEGLGVLGIWTAAAVLAGWLVFRIRSPPASAGGAAGYVAWHLLRRRRHLARRLAGVTNQPWPPQLITSNAENLGDSVAQHVSGSFGTSGMSDLAECAEQRA